MNLIFSNLRKKIAFIILLFREFSQKQISKICMYVFTGSGCSGAWGRAYATIMYAHNNTVTNFQDKADIVFFFPEVTFHVTFPFDLLKFPTVLDKISHRLFVKRFKYLTESNCLLQKSFIWILSWSLLFKIASSQ